MTAVDWIIVVTSCALLAGFGIYSSRFMHSVADFLAANRAGGRYMLSIASAMAGTGAISAIAMFEMHANSGLPPLWWTLMSIPVGVVIILSGWVYYRFRETRCLTMAQFFEVRYSKPFRVYAAILMWLAGIVNFGIFPIVEARFFVYFLGWPQYIDLMGLQIYTVSLVMLLTLGVSTLFAILGGQITVMLTDCAQGIFCSFIYLAVCFYLLHHFGWVEITGGLQAASSPGKSMLNPFDTADADFNAWFFLIGVFGSFYGYMSWQGSAGYRASGISPHEQKMAQVIGIWRQLPLSVMFVLIPICAVALLNLPQHAGEAEHVRAALGAIDNEAIQKQMTSPIALAQMLPPGLKGLMCVVMLFFLITTQDTYLHSWGSMLVQDVIMPLRRRAFQPRQHVLLLRLSVLFVAVFSFFFGLYFVQTEYILMYMAITGAIVSGAGAVIVGGLYWRHGTALAAWVAMTIGWIMAAGSMVLSQVQAHWFPDAPPPAERGPLVNFIYWVNSIDGQVTWFWTMIFCLTSYVLISVVTGLRRPFNLEKMLHRGPYRVDDDHAIEEPRVPLWWKITGFTREFSSADRWLAVALVVWNFGWFAVFACGTIYHSITGISDSFWPGFWQTWIWTNLLIGIPATIWFAIGGVNDIRLLFLRIRSIARDSTDDGRVSKSKESPQENAVRVNQKTSSEEFAQS